MIKIGIKIKHKKNRSSSSRQNSNAKAPQLKPASSCRHSRGEKACYRNVHFPAYVSRVGSVTDALAPSVSGGKSQPARFSKGFCISDGTFAAAGFATKFYFVFYSISIGTFFPFREEISVGWGENPFARETDRERIAERIGSSECSFVTQNYFPRRRKVEEVSS